ncbi:dipeptide ABC transporter ATP-binding protein [Desulfogranum marinum]|uniref:ABC transporter ATP-binding protein n=1 Tax=Desulfogranum marinum TaxID=453220 RepID=UPI0029C65A81|nr:dipeptide ABC transporter ATP-binding protein [Desulfogranum marinum]
MTALLSIQNLSLQFDASSGMHGKQFSLSNVSFDIAQGEIHALVGESGSGKSVTALSVLRLLEDVSNVSGSGRITFNGKRIDALSKKEVRTLRGNQIAMIFQEPMTSLNPVYTIGNQLLEPLMLHQKQSKAQAYANAISLLDRTGIKNPESRFSSYPHQLSGGQRQRVMIAMALACRPKLLIADEPTTALDITIQEQILDLIQDIQQEYGMSVLLITHDLTMVKQRAETVSIMHQGKIIEQGTTLSIFKDPKQPYTVHLLNSIPSATAKERPATPPLLELKDIACTFTMKSGWAGFMKPKVTVVKAVDHVDISLEKKKTLGIVGESGSGKSTLAMCLLGLYKFSGQVLYHTDNGILDLATFSNRRFRPYRKDLQIVFQDPFSSLSPRMSIEQIIGEGLGVHKIGENRAERRRMIYDALTDVELDPDAADRFPHEFSGGQRQRIAIARALILRPKLLILDEPTSALDMTIQHQILDLLQKLQTRYGMTYVFITHDLRTIRAIADNIAVMQNGKIVEAGCAATVFAKPQHAYTQALFKAAFH